MNSLTMPDQEEVGIINGKVMLSTYITMLPYLDGQSHSETPKKFISYQKSEWKSQELTMHMKSKTDEIWRGLGLA